MLLEVRDEVGFGHPWALGDAGDFQANELLLRRLRAERPGDAVLSEEAHDDLVRLRSDRVWIIDPLDGTREFSTPGRDDWAVHIALWQRPHQTAGREITDAAVALPARGNIVYRSDTVTADAAPVGVPGTLAHRRQRHPAPRGPAPHPADAGHPTRGDRFGGRQGDGRHRRPRRRVPARRWPMGMGFGGAGRGDHGRRHARVAPGRLAAAYNQLDPYLPDFVMCRAEVAPLLLGAIRDAWR